MGQYLKGNNMAQIKIQNVMRIPKLLILVISGRVKIQLIYENFHWTLQSWTLISRQMRNVAENCFSAKVPKVLIFCLLVRTETINDFSY